jgi:hypothetical protein
MKRNDLTHTFISPTKEYKETKYSSENSFDQVIMPNARYQYLAILIISSVGN